MAIPSLSPAVTTNEFDFTLTARAIPQTSGAIAGHFQWGPVERRVLVDSEATLRSTFFIPNDATYTAWLSAASFLSYASGLWVSRANSSGHLNATATGTGVPIRNELFYESNFLGAGLASAGLWAARYMGDLGNAIRVSICGGNTAFEGRMNSLAQVSVGNNQLIFSSNVRSDSGSRLAVGDFINITGVGTSTPANTGWIEVINIDDTTTSRNVFVRTSDALSLFTTANVAGAVVQRRWAYAPFFQGAPRTSVYAESVGGSNDEIHIAVVDRTGVFSGIANSVLETYPYVSVANDAVKQDGSPNYYRDVLYQKSKYVYWTGHLTEGSNWGTVALNKTFVQPNVAVYNNLSGGTIGTPSDANIITALDQFRNPEEVDISFIIGGNSSNTVIQYALQSIAEIRYDCIVTFSPRITDVVETPGNELNNIINYVNTFYRSVFGVMDSGWKYMYDRYNNVYRYVPLNGDIAGLMARTLNPWDSPAGPNKGLIKNAIRLAWNPTKAQRDELYRRGVNPVVTFPGEGIQLFGDKTFTLRATAFDRINVRRLFSYLEKVIARAARNSLFELNDEFTRARFVGVVEPFLRDVLGKRGIYDFRVVCDETNNTPQVIDSNQFIGDIYIKPARSINDVQLNFIATPTGVVFDEIIGRFGG